VWDCGSGSEPCPATPRFLARGGKQYGSGVVNYINVLLLGGLPTWGYHSYGYGPTGIVGVLLIVIIVLLLTGRI